MLKHLILLASVLVLVHAQSYGQGGCPKIPSKKNFSLTEFAGRWYQQYRYFNTLEGTTKCNVLNVNVTVKPYTANHIGIGLLNNKQKKISTTFTLAKKLVGDFKTKKVSSEKNLLPKRWRVVDTDYKTYAVLYSCQSYLLFHKKTAWIYTRSQGASSLSKSVIAAKKVMDTYGIKKSLPTMITTDQLFCPLKW